MSQSLSLAFAPAARPASRTAKIRQAATAAVRETLGMVRDIPAHAAIEAGVVVATTAASAAFLISLF